MSNQEPTFSDRVASTISKISDLTDALALEQDIERFTEKLKGLKSTLFSIYIRRMVYETCFEKLPTDIKGKVLVEEKTITDLQKVFNDCKKLIAEEKNILSSAIQNRNIGAIERSTTKLEGKKNILDLKLRGALETLKRGYNVDYSFIEDLLDPLIVALEEVYSDLDLNFFGKKKQSFIESISFDKIFSESIYGENDEEIKESLKKFKQWWKEKIEELEKVKSIVSAGIIDLEEEFIDLLRKLPKEGVQILSYGSAEEPLDPLMRDLSTLRERFPQIFQKLYVVYRREVETGGE